MHLSSLHSVVGAVVHPGGAPAGASGADTVPSQKLCWKDDVHELVAPDPPEHLERCNQVEDQPGGAGTVAGQELRGKEDGAGQVAAAH